MDTDKLRPIVDTLKCIYVPVKIVFSQKMYQIIYQYISKVSDTDTIENEVSLHFYLTKGLDDLLIMNVPISEVPKKIRE